MNTKMSTKDVDGNPDLGFAKPVSRIIIPLDDWISNCNTDMDK
jgi:hypothetical protein